MIKVVETAGGYVANARAGARRCTLAAAAGMAGELKSLVSIMSSYALRVRSSRIGSRLSHRPIVVDAALAAAVFGVGLLGMGYSGWACEMGFTAAFSVPLILRRRYPVNVAVAVAVVGVVQIATVTPPMPADLAAFVALYTVAAYAQRRVAFVAAGIAAITGLVLALQDFGAGVPTSVPILLGRLALTEAPFAAAWLAGTGVRIRRQYVAELEQRAAHLTSEMGSQARAAAAEERTRIARELHDIVAHRVSVIVVQAAGAARIVEQDPVQGKSALETIAATGQLALTEMRQLLQVLRTDDRGPDRAPQPGLDDLDTLVTRLRAAGQRIAISVTGTPRPMPATVSLVAYRVVQEALTNTVRHAGADASSTVHIAYDQRALQLRIEDDGGTRPHRDDQDTGNSSRGRVDTDSTSDSDGHGLIGMRERVSAVGGTLTIGPRGGGGFTVRANLPIRESS